MHASLAAGLPLLQAETRRHCKRAFAAAAKALEVVASPLTKLRTQLHLECAKCDADDDALIKVGRIGGSRCGVLPRPALGHYIHVLEGQLNGICVKSCPTRERLPFSV